MVCRFAHMNMRYRLGFFLVIVIVLGGSWGCEKPLVTVNEGSLNFSPDTVKFDSIFRNFLTPSERLVVANNTDENIEISRIWLESGDETQFSMIVDGIKGNDISDIVIRKEDSLLVLVNFISEIRDDFVEEFISFQIGDNVQRVPISAFVLDAFLLRSRVIDNQLEGFFFQRDTFLTPEKPIIMDGAIIVPEDVTVTILPGTHIFFTPYKVRTNMLQSPPDTFVLFSQLFVNGTVNAIGTPDQPIILEGSRLEPDFFELPAQWRGVEFAPGSKDNILKHVLIKNAIYGVRVDSTSVNTQPKVIIQNSEIRNMSAYGIWGVGFSGDLGLQPALLMENSLVHTCKEQTAFLWIGGNYEFYNCTFANFNLARVSRRSPQISITDFLEAPPNLFVVPTRAKFTNCIIWGSEEDEIGLELVGGAPLDISFNHTLIRYSDDNEVDISPYLENAIINQDPLFNDIFNIDYRPQEGSPVIDAGIDLSNRFLGDIRGRMDSLRSLPYDLGAYEFYPIE